MTIGQIMANCFPVIPLLVVLSAFWVYCGLPLHQFVQMNRRRSPVKSQMLFMAFVAIGYALGFAWLIITSAP
jgi:hypothetical protein